MYYDNVHTFVNLCVQGCALVYVYMHMHMYVIVNVYTYKCI